MKKAMTAKGNAKSDTVKIVYFWRPQQTRFTNDPLREKNSATGSPRAKDSATEAAIPPTTNAGSWGRPVLSDNSCKI